MGQQQQMNMMNSWSPYGNGMGGNMNMQQMPYNPMMR